MEITVFLPLLLLLLVVVVVVVALHCPEEGDGGKDGEDFMDDDDRGFATLQHTPHHTPEK